MNNFLDASTLDNNTNYDSSQFVDELEDKLSTILHREFPDCPSKQRVKKTTQGFAIACPYCGDSATQTNKKRGNFVLSGQYAGTYKCFNCGKFTTIPKFINDFNESLSLSGIRYCSEHKAQLNATGGKSQEITADVFCKELALKYGIERNQFRDWLGMTECDQSYRGKTAYEYLVGRYQFKFNNFLYDPKSNYLVILNLVENHVIGFQLRSLNKNCPKDKRFLTFNLNRIYKQLFKRPDIEIPEDVNTISTVFDLYNVNVYQPIIVTEGPMDAFLLPNAIASAGANKKLTVELPFYYLFDADETGNKHAIEKLRAGNKVFLWGKFKRAMGLPKLNPFAKNKKDSNKWDVNDVVKYCYKQYGQYYKIDWLQYFSNNPMDMIYLDDISMMI